MQGLSQVLESGGPKLAIVKCWAVQIFMGDHNILIQCPGNHIEMITFNNMPENDILRNSSLKSLGVLRGAF